MIKMLISDMDGTLLDSHHVISKENLDAIQKLRENDIRFAIATGRSAELVKEYIEPLQMTDPMIMCNGAVINNPFYEKELLNVQLDRSDVEQIVTYAINNNLDCMLYTKNAVIYTKTKKSEKENIDKKSSTENTGDKTNYVFNNNVKDLIEEEVNKILISEQDLDKFDVVFNDIKKYKHLNIASSFRGFIDINSKPSSKGYALEVLANYYGYKLDEIVVIGDQDNDISMFDKAGVKIAMGNAITEVKNRADFITLTNNESGVAHYINHILLKNGTNNK